MSSTMARVSRNSRTAGGIDAGDEREHAERERDVGRHRDAPAPWPPRPPGCTREVQERRDDHAADRRDHRQRRLPPVAQLAEDQLALDLEPDDEEEDRHQPVVDPVPQVELELRSARAGSPSGVCQSGVVARLPRRVGPHERDRRGHEEQDPARGLGGEEVPERARETGAVGSVRRCARGMVVGPRGEVMPTRLPGARLARTLAVSGVGADVPSGDGAPPGRGRRGAPRRRRDGRRRGDGGLGWAAPGAEPPRVPGRRDGGRRRRVGRRALRRPRARASPYRSWPSS